MKQINNIIYFENILEFENYLFEKRITKKLGEGSEGRCYLSLTDNSVYKIMNYKIDEYLGNTRKLDKIITTKDIKLDSFSFPDLLFVVGKKLVGYRTNYVTPDLFDFYNLTNNYENMYKINYNSLTKAYYNMLDDVEKLSKEQIRICDLGCNLIFTGKKLVGIDTCYYNKVDYNPYGYNEEEVTESLKKIIDTWIECNPNIDNDEAYYIVGDYYNMYKYLHNVSKLVKKIKNRS